jgi:2-polyprenyl-6-methoxyphenol hydroxylase-like FAD-dependent oxidoreductase
VALRPKFDGFRGLLRRSSDGDLVRLTSRQGKDLTDWLPEPAQAGKCLPRSTVLDGDLHSRTIEILDQRGIADRFLSQGQVAQVAQFSMTPLDISDFPTRYNNGLGLWQDRIEHTLAGWVHELRVPIYRGREVTGFAQDDTGVDVDVELSDGQSIRRGTSRRVRRRTQSDP